MGLLEKRRCKNFFVFVQNFDPKNPKTYDGIF
jgi:RAB protein geranylgeranyltransferase component A